MRKNTNKTAVRKQQNRQRRADLQALSFLLPSLLPYTVFLIIPIFATLRLSLYSWNGIKSSPQHFVGLQNYAKLFQNSTFLTSLGNSCCFVLATLLFIMPVSFLLAYILYKRLKFSGFFKTVFYLPSILPIAATGLMWCLMMALRGGVINAILTALHLPAQDWLGNTKIAIWAIVFVHAWLNIGQNMLIFLAGLTSVPDELLDAAAIDGAVGLRKLLYVVIPSMLQSFKVFLVTGISTCFKVFAIIYIMTGGGPGNATDVPATLLYDYTYNYAKFGTGAAIGVIIMVISLLVSFVMNRCFDRDDG